MNKSLIAVLLLGLIVVAMAAEVKDRAKSAKMEKLRERKAKLMAKKEKMHLDKVKKGMRDMPFGRKPDLLAEKQAFKAKYEAMKEQVKSGLMSKDEFKRIMREESKRGRAEEKTAKKSGASRNKRSTKEAFRKVSKNAVKMDKKKRRSPTA